jgi:hypothetical protein
MVIEKLKLRVHGNRVIELNRILNKELADPRREIDPATEKLILQMLHRSTTKSAEESTRSMLGLSMKIDPLANINSNPYPFKAETEESDDSFYSVEEESMSPLDCTNEPTYVAGTGA